MSAREFGDLLYAAAPDLGNHLWQTTAFAALAAGLVFALRRNEARVRYWVWMAASVKFLVPFAVLAVAAGHLAPRHVVAPEKADVYFAVNQVSEPFAPPAVLPQPYVPVVPPMHRGALALAAIWA